MTSRELCLWQDVEYINYHGWEGISRDDYWDFGMLKGYLDKTIWDPVGSYSFPEQGIMVEQGHIFVVTGRHHQKDVEKINIQINRADWAIVFIMGDEENDFPVEQLEHPRMSIWVMSPTPGRHDSYHKMGSGWPPQIREIEHEYSLKPKDWFFSGQVVHDQRERMAERLRELPDGELNETQGFTQGYPHEEYYGKMVAAKTCPAPAGSFTPDSFRFFEALELGCVPIAGAMPSISGYPDNYWTNLFGQISFPIIADWNALPHQITTIREQWPSIGNKVYAWWQNYKRDQAYEIHDEIFRYVRQRPPAGLKDKLTVLIPTSPIKSHPSLEIIEQTIESVRDRLPDCEILIMCDGVRPEQKYMRDQYDWYLNRLLWKSNWEYHNVLPVLFDEFSHQAAMTKQILDKVRTPAILFVEHDCPLEGDIPFPQLVDNVVDNRLDMIRLHHETMIGEYHRHLMLDPTPIDIGGVPMVRTVQWSQRPHIANTEYYRKILTENFSENSRTMIEDKMHSVAQSNPWDSHRIAIYHNEGNIQHSITTDGRQGDEKYGDTYVF